MSSLTNNGEMEVDDIIQAVAAATWFGRLAETNFEFPFDFARIISGLWCTIEASMTEAEKRVREYLAKIGCRGGLASRRELTRSRAKQMVAIREAKRAAMQAGKPWPPRDRKLLKSTWDRFDMCCIISRLWYMSGARLGFALARAGELAIVRAREKAEKTLGAKFNIRAFHDPVLDLGWVPLPLWQRGSTASSPKTAKALTRIWSE
jgi:hypothetical protein